MWHECTCNALSPYTQYIFLLSTYFMQVTKHLKRIKCSLNCDVTFSGMFVENISDVIYMWLSVIASNKVTTCVTWFMDADLHHEYFKQQNIKRGLPFLCNAQGLFGWQRYLLLLPMIFTNVIVHIIRIPRDLEKIHNTS